MTSAGTALMTCLFILAMQKTTFPYYIALARTQEYLREDKAERISSAFSDICKYRVQDVLPFDLEEVENGTKSTISQVIKSY